VPYDWTSAPAGPDRKEISPERAIWFISDLHLGDGSASDVFVGKDRALIALLERVRDEGARLVVCGDAIDFHQAWDLTRVLRAHGKLLRALSELADTNGVIYIHGNHDNDIALYRDVLRFDVCGELAIGPDILVRHGHQFDPFIGPNVSRTGIHTRIHHLIERLTHAWIRAPLAEFYNPVNRFTYWFAYHCWHLGMLRNRVIRALGDDHRADRAEAYARYWVRNEVGDPMDMLRPALAFSREHRITLVCGHAHMPGRVEVDGARYVNTGSWTFGWSQYAVWDGRDFTVRDWLTGRTYRDELYRSALDGEIDRLDFGRWWRSEYLGWFKFRSGEARRALGG
jgi:UDP-2,3-diacylglucosamine pyrophosphatase LpxH